MSDEQMPAWAQAMEHRLIEEISKAIATSEARITRRLDEVRDGVGGKQSRKRA